MVVMVLVVGQRFRHSLLLARANPSVGGREAVQNGLGARPWCNTCVRTTEMLHIFKGMCTYFFRIVLLQSVGKGETSWTNRNMTGVLLRPRASGKGETWSKQKARKSWRTMASATDRAICKMFVRGRFAGSAMRFSTKISKVEMVRNSAQRGAPELSTPPLCSFFRGDFENRHERVRNSKINFGKMTLFPGFRGPGGPTAYARPTNVTPFPGCCTFPRGL